MRANVEFNHVLHERVVIVTVRTDDVPRVRRRDRVEVDDLGYADDGIAHVTARFGFADDPDVPDALRLAQAQGSSATSTSTSTSTVRARPTSCRGSRSRRATRAACDAGGRSCSSSWRATPPAPFSTSSSR